MITQLADHLWQSTLFALAAGLLALTLKRHSAGARYGLWFAASLKFLIPFALLAAAGEGLAARLHLTLIPPHEAAAASLDWAPQLMAPATAFGTAPPTPAVVPAAHALVSGGPAQEIDPAPLLFATVLFSVWALGLALILLVWGLRWSRIRAALRAAEPVDLAAPIPVLASPAGLEPGVVGLWRPVLLLPEGVTERLPPAELNAILAHELSHVRRRDNLTGAIHMLVQALFWFHPLVWWLGARLIAERERACDEAVVRAGHDRETYARGIIQTCRIYLHAPLACVAGASGGKLAMRVDTILTGPLSAPLPLEARAALGLMGAMALAVPVGAGLLTAPQIAEPLISRPLAVLAQAARVAPLFQPAATAAQSTAAPPAARTGPAASAVPDAPAALAEAPVATVQTAALPTSDAPAEAPSRVAWPPEPPRVQLKPAAEPAQMTATLEAAAASPSTVSPAAVQGDTPAEIRRQAYRFAERFAATTVKLNQVARWVQPVCVAVQGLQPQGAGQIKARVEEVAASLGLGSRGAGCTPNVQIMFTNQPQALMDRVAARHELLLGYWHHRDRDKLKTVTRPIQAWYVTGTRGGAGSVIGAAISGADTAPTGATGAPSTVFQVDDEDNTMWGVTGCGDNPHFTSCRMSEFQHVLVVVDLSKVGAFPPGPIADYVAMLALAQSKPLDGCTGLPSVIGLFSGCPDDAGRDGLTRADAAYLTALYKTDLQAKKAVQVTDIAGRMADLLIRTGAIQVADAKTEAGPERK